jgi:hypothetical protein
MFIEDCLVLRCSDWNSIVLSQIQCNNGVNDSIFHEKILKQCL